MLSHNSMKRFAQLHTCAVTAASVHCNSNAAWLPGACVVSEPPDAVRCMNESLGECARPTHICVSQRRCFVPASKAYDMTERRQHDCDLSELETLQHVAFSFPDVSSITVASPALSHWTSAIWSSTR